MKLIPESAPTSLTCVRCRYRLDGLDAVGGRIKCPECGEVCRIRLVSDAFPRGMVLEYVALGLGIAGVFLTAAAPLGLAVGAVAYEVSEGRRGAFAMVVAGLFCLIRLVMEVVALSLL